MAEHSVFGFLPGSATTPRRPGNVMTITSSAQLANLIMYDTLIFQGTFALVDGGYADYNVPTNITTIFLAGLGAKLHFKYSGGIHSGFAVGACWMAASVTRCGLALTMRATTACRLRIRRPICRRTPTVDGIVITDHRSRRG